MRVGVVTGCGVCFAVESVGGDGGGGGVLLAWAGVRVCCPVCCARCGVSGGVGWGRSTDIGPELGPRCMVACGGGGACPATRSLTTSKW